MGKHSTRRTSDVAWLALGGVAGGALGVAVSLFIPHTVGGKGHLAMFALMAVGVVLGARLVGTRARKTSV